MNNKVWATRLDNRYNIYVERIEAYKGKLIILDGDKEIYNNSTSLSYDAYYGADIEDIINWENESLKFIDEVYNKKI